jgi:aspartate beta-hydroxylase
VPIIKRKNSTLRELYQRAKSLDTQAEKERSNSKLLEAIKSYKDLIEINGDILNDTIFIEIAERSIERSRFIGKMKMAVDMHYKLIHRFVDEPSYLNQLAVTYLLANR